MIKAVTFDLWSTLFCVRHYGDYRVDVMIEVLENEGFSIDRSRIEAQYASALEHFNKEWRKEKKKQFMSATNVVEFILRNLSVGLQNSPKSVVVEGFEKAILRDPPLLMNDVETVLESFRGWCRLGLISNSGITPGNILRRVLKSHKILQYFQCTIFSDELGYTKPHFSIFKETLEKLQVKAEEAIHVGDLLDTDVAGAKAIGMKTVWFNSSGTSLPEGRIVPDYEIEALPQLLKILEAIGIP